MYMQHPKNASNEYQMSTTAEKMRTLKMMTAAAAVLKENVVSLACLHTMCGSM